MCINNDTLGISLFIIVCFAVIISLFYIAVYTE